MTKYSKHVSKKEVTQDTQLLGSNQITNSDGCYVWAVDNWKQLDRFLVLGTSGGSYYATERRMTVDNAQAVLACIKEDGIRTVNRIVEVSDKALAPKNDPAIFALALCTVHGDEQTRKFANSSLSKVCRTGTHLFQFAENRKDLAGWGRGVKRAISDWYNQQSPSNLAYQLIKYQNRNGWSHKDLLRLSHAKPTTYVHDRLFQFAVGKGPGPSLEILEGFHKVREATTPKQVANVIKTYNLPREVVPTEFLKEKEVWAALLENMPMTAMIRNLGNMSKAGLLTPLSNAEKVVTEKLANKAELKKARVHPLQLLVAYNTYEQGKGMRGSGAWDVSNNVVAALDSAFYLSFDNVEPANKRTLLAIDTSQSMNSGECAGMTGITPRIGSACMAMVTVATEPQTHSIAFSDKAMSLNLNKKQSLKEVIKEIESKPAYDTNVSAPMTHALAKKYEVDTFVIYTDGETNTRGALQPHAALQKYRDATGIPAKLVVVGMVANNFTVADPSDAGMLDLVGFDTTAPSVISGFSRGDF